MGQARLPKRSDWRLNERHYGALQGQHRSAVEARVGGAIGIGGLDCLLHIVVLSDGPVASSSDIASHDEIEVIVDFAADFRGDG